MDDSEDPSDESAKGPTDKKNRTIRIPPIDRLDLPLSLPKPETLKSWGQTEYTYLPDIWELEYVPHRYLRRVEPQALADRYESIVTNMYALVRPERDAIPINSFHSSWYWHRKEHITRLEFALRDLPLPRKPPVGLIDSTPISSPIKHGFPDGKDVIFRYSEMEFLADFVRHGRIRIVPATNYNNETYNDARRDEEASKHAYWAGDYTKITMQDGREIPIIGDVQRTVTSADYSLISFSCDWDPDLFGHFGDTCAVVHNTAEFTKIVGDATRDAFPGWYFHDNPVQYFDPYEMTKDEYFSSSMCKDFRFAYQREYRLLWANHSGGAPVNDMISVDIGPLGHLVSLYDRRGKEIRL